MITSTMPLLTIHHKTEYRYAHPVAFGEHRIMLRPRDGHDLRMLTGSLEIAPPPMSLLRRRVRRHGSQHHVVSVGEDARG